jgi:hypothetical protein
MPPTTFFVIACSVDLIAVNLIIALLKLIQEDVKLIQLVETYGPQNWSLIAKVGCWKTWQSYFFLFFFAASVVVAPLFVCH